ncbi:hypothetical protein EMCRGX_G021388 [Ephydatia muelleri]
MDGTEEQIIVPSLEQAKRITKELRKLQFSNPGPQMRANATDTRLRKALQRCFSCQYDELGRLLPSLLDQCDCMDPACPGCFLPCNRCKSNKCGGECRCGRMWKYERVVSMDTADTMWQYTRK